MNEKHVTPSRLIGNLYFVGTYEASTHIIATEEGLIMIDPGYSKTLPTVLCNMHTLGFSETDIKYILISHAHYDHMEATDELVRLTGAKTFIGEDDLPLLRGEIYHYPMTPFEPDVLLHDEDVVTLGGISVRCVATPGHTDGTISFFFDVEEGGKTYRAGMFGGAGCNTMRKDFLKKYNLPYDCRQKFVSSIKKLMREKVDVFIGNHVWNNNTDEKINRLAASTENPFIVPGEWEAFLEERLEAVNRVIANNE